MLLSVFSPRHLHFCWSKESLYFCHLWWWRAKNINSTKEPPLFLSARMQMSLKLHFPINIIWHFITSYISHVTFPPAIHPRAFSPFVLDTRINASVSSDPSLLKALFTQTHVFPTTNPLISIWQMSCQGRSLPRRRERALDRERGCSWLRLHWKFYVSETVKDECRCVTVKFVGYNWK